MGADVVGEGCAEVVAHRDVFAVGHLQTVACYLSDMVGVDNKTAVHLYEVRGHTCHHFAHRQQGRQRFLAVDEDAHIFAQAADMDAAAKAITPIRIDFFINQECL